MSAPYLTPEQREERFWAKVEPEPMTGCWLWTANAGRYGHGVFHDGRRSVKAYRWAYEHLVGPIPDGLTIDHLCRTPACVNPAHLEPVTMSENIRRSNLANPRPRWKLWDGECSKCHRSGMAYRSRGRICSECGRAYYRAWYARTQGKDAAR